MLVNASILIFYVLSLLHSLHHNVESNNMAVITPPKLPALFINKNGKYRYVMTYTSKWDKVKKNSRRTSSKTVGTLGDDGVIKFRDEFLVQYPTLEQFKVTRVDNEFKFEVIDTELYSIGKSIPTTQMHGGATYALDAIVKSSPLWEALKRTFPQNNNLIANKILSIAYYIVLNKQNTMHYYDVFAESTMLPYQKVMSEASVSRLFDSITHDDKDRFFSKLVDLYEKSDTFDLSKDVFLAIDSTSISTYSTNLSKSDFGKNKDGDELRQINLLLLVEQQTGLPLYYRLYDGAVPDISTVRRTIADEVRLDIARKYIMVADKGYPGKNNIDDALRNKVHFLFNLKTQRGLQVVSSAIDDNRNEFLDVNNYNKYIGQYCYTEEYSWKYDEFPVNGKRAQNKSVEKCYLHMYFDNNIYTNARNILCDNVTTVKDKLNSGQDISAKEKEFYDMYIEQSEDTLSYTINNAKVEENLKYKGFRVLISDTIKDPIAAYTAYQERNQVEYAFHTLKSRLNCNRFYVSKDSTLEGKVFVQFIATIISIMVRNRLKNYELNAKNASDNFTLVYESDNKVLQMLNNIMVTKFKDGLLYDEVVGKKKRLFAALGIPVPTVVTSDYKDEDISDPTTVEELVSISPAPI